MKHGYHDMTIKCLRSMPLVYHEKEKDAREEGAQKKKSEVAAETVVELTTALPDLGTLSFLSHLTDIDDATVFDCDTMALVVEKLWKEHISSKFYTEIVVFLVFTISWMLFCEVESRSEADMHGRSRLPVTVCFIILLLLNSYFMMRELRQAKKQAEMREGVVALGISGGEQELGDGLGAWLNLAAAETQETKKGKRCARHPILSSAT
jgi:hypothetical protein